ncbi:Homocysteine S-methyltransferase [Russula earlei]|uniref:Homocysteine S-methyltransferase n=1 Tax=Russula earlei TaxID=71964 RepID=A0ACC0TZR1_9AGAM|nr:Homocysteine S-methyltransferase [Russula earlei]
MFKLFPPTLPVLIDGGLGSTLEDVFQIDTASSLWSSEALIKCPQSVIDTHLIFLRAGARLIETASYQGSFSTYARAGYSRDDARRLMRSSVTLAADARSRFAAEAHVPIDGIKIALSLAAYGASLSLPHEFDGHYPPPYGPQAYRTRGASEESLMAFHLERLRVYASDKETWRAVNALAFETVPLAREVRAIRRAIAALEGEIAPGERKPWWICAVYTGGQFPEERPGGGGERLGAKEVIAAYFDDPPTAATGGDRGIGHEGATRYAVPDAFGINCTAVTHVAGAVAAANDALAEMGASCSSGAKPWLVLKPNGGQTYDMDTRKWGWYGGEGRSQGEEWARKLGDIVRTATSKGVWGGVLVGGCCKTGEEELRILSRVLQEKESEVCGNDSR